MMTGLRAKAKLRGAALALSLTAMLGGSAQATQLWYDGFSLTDAGGDYVVNSALNGTSGGSGSFFTGNWVAADQGDAASWAQAQGTGLTRPGLSAPTVGGAAGRDVQFDCCVFTRTSRLFSTPWGGFTDPDGTYYMGFLVNFGTGTANDPHHRTVEMHDGGFDDNANRNLMLGISNFAGLGTQLALNVRDSVTNSSTNVVLSENANVDNLAVQGTHYMVLKFEMSTSADDVISAYLDPVGTSEPTASASVTVGQFLADRLSTNAQFTFNSAAPSAAGHFDEVRVGTEFADVAINTLAFDGRVVPEPTSLGLMGIALLGLMFGRRK
jgi:hypothetical protein